MHSSSYLEMGKNIEKYLWEYFSQRVTILEVGSRSAAGSFKHLMPPKWKYTGVDIKEGPNVDIVMPDKYDIPFPDGTFEVVISGQCLEHVENPFKLMKECHRVMKQNAWCFHVAPYQYPLHDKPDRFRFLPAGMKGLFRDSGIVTQSTYLVNSTEIIAAYNTTKAHIKIGEYSDCWGIGRRR